MTRILLVDDHALVRDSLRARFEREDDLFIVGEADTAEGAIAQADLLAPDLIVLDIRLRDSSGIDAAKVIRRDQPQIKILVLSAYEYDAYVKAFTELAVDAFVNKEQSPEDLIATIRSLS